jgi:hypothetical protein
MSPVPMELWTTLKSLFVPGSLAYSFPDSYMSIMTDSIVFSGSLHGYCCFYFFCNTIILRL